MRKQPVGYFIDPTTKEVVAIIARNNEAPENARKRVAEKHSIDVTIISEKPPEGGLNPGLIVELPDRSPEDMQRRAMRRREEPTNPADAVARYHKRLSGTPKPIGDSVETKLIGGTDKLLGEPPPPSSRSFAAEEQSGENS